MQGRQTNSNIYYIKGLAQEALKSGITIDEVNEVFNRKNEAIKNSIDAETMSKLQLISNVMNSSINNQTYNH